MPDYNRDDNQQRDHAPKPKGRPHDVGWFWRLLGLYQRQSHPLAADLYGEDSEYTANFQQWYVKQLRLTDDRKERFRIYDEMDKFPLVSAVLDIYAEESTQKDYDKGKSVWVESNAEHMIKAGEECLHNCQVEDKIATIVRKMCKYGDDFRRLIYEGGKGVLAWHFTKPHTMLRVDDKFGRLVGFKEDGKQFRGAKKRKVSWPWDYVHFRLLGKDEETGMGTSVLEALFRPWRMMTLTEDGMLMYRLRRAPDRNAVYIDCGDMEDDEAMEYVESWRKRFRKYEFVDPACVDLHQVVRTLSGNMTVQQIIDAYDRGEEIWVYGYDENTRQIAAGRVSWAGITRKDATLVEVALDDGTKVICTPDHPFAVMNGTPNKKGPTPHDAATTVTWVHASDLVAGCQLVPLRVGSHLKGGCRRYETWLDPFGGWGFAHQRVCEAVGTAVGADEQCHHIDGNTLNNHPSNLSVMSTAEHTRHHSNDRYAGHSEMVVCSVCGASFRVSQSRLQNGRGRFCSRKCSRIGKSKADPSKHPNMQALYARNRAEGRLTLECTYCGESYTVLRSVYARRGSKFCSTRCAGRHRAKVRQGLVPVPNHRVKAVRVLARRADTGDVTVEKLSNFFVADSADGGVLVHNSPNYRKQYNPLTPLEDIFIPKRGAQDHRIDTLSGAGNVDDVYDLNHYVNSFFGAARVPKAYAGYEGEINAKATLSQQDIRFARTMKRIQKAATYGLRQLLDTHYALLPTDANDTTYKLDLPENTYVVQMSPISYLDEWERLELVQLRYQIIESMSRLAMDMQLDARTWAAYVLLNYAKLPENLVLKLMNKTPESTAPPAGDGFESVAHFFDMTPEKYKEIMGDPAKRTQIMESMGIQGFYNIKPEEEVAIAKIMHESAPLRKVVGDIAEYCMEDVAANQTDPSLLPPIINGVTLTDDYEDDKEAKLLQEDIDSVKRENKEP